VTDGGSNLIEAANLLNYKRLHCGNHVIQLALNKGLKEMCIFVTKCSKIVQLFRQSSSCTKIEKSSNFLDVEKKPKEIIDFVEARWKSVLGMTERLLGL
jgi:hypothetical protein